MVRGKHSSMGSNWGNISSVTSPTNKKSARADKSNETSNAVEEHQDDDLRISKFLRFSNESCYTNDVDGSPDDAVHLTTIHENEDDCDDGAEVFGEEVEEDTERKQDLTLR